jgi:hypothetical protein
MALWQLSWNVKDIRPFLALPIFKNYTCLHVKWHFSSTSKDLCVISGLSREADEICALLRHYAAQSGDFLPTFRDNLSVPSSGVNKSQTRSRITNVFSKKRGLALSTTQPSVRRISGVFSFGVKLTTHAHLVWSLRMSAAIPPLPCMPSWHA